MTFLPIVERELRLAARRAGTYWLRFWIALVFGGICLIMASQASRSPAQQGKYIFTTVTSLAFGYCLLAGVRYSADCLSEEKREGTLGLLFLTDLRGYDVVLGKLAATSLHSFYGLLAIIPLLGLPFFMGGITGGEFWRMNLVLLNTLFLSLALGTLISAIGREERQVMLATFFAVLLLTAGFAGFWRLATASINRRFFDLVFLLPNPGYAYHSASDAVLQSGRSDFWLSMLTILVLGTICIALASFLLPRVFQEKGRFAPGSRWQERFHRWRFGNSSRRGARVEHWRPSSLFQWLASRDRLPKIHAWALMIVTIGFGFWIFPIVRRPRATVMQIAVFGSLGLHLLFKFLVAVEACRRLWEDRRTGSLELLLATPLGVGAILRGQLAALRRLFRWPMAGLMLLNFLWIAALPHNDFKEIGIVLVGGMIVIIPDFFALSWIGMWVALRTQRYPRAVVGTIGRVLAPAWLLLLLFIFTTFNRGVSRPTMQTIVFSWFALGIVYDLVLVGWAKAKLTREFRSLALQSYDSASVTESIEPGPPRKFEEDFSLLN